MILHWLNSNVSDLTQQRDGEGKGKERPAGARCEFSQPSHGKNIVRRLHAASLARTHEQNEDGFPVGLTHPASDIKNNIYIYMIN